RLAVFQGECSRGLAAARRPVRTNQVSYGKEGPPVVGIAIDEAGHIGVVTGNLVTDIIRPPSAHAGKILQLLAPAFPQFGDGFVGATALHLNDDRPLLQVVGQSTICCKGNGAEDGELAKFLVISEDANNGPAGAMPLVQQGMKIAAVFDVFLGLVENDRRMELLDCPKQCRRRNTASTFRSADDLIEKPQDRRLAAAFCW